MRTLKTIAQTATLLAMAAAVQVGHAACFMVVAPDSSVVYRSLESPVDLSLPLHMTLPDVAPGGALVFAPDSYGCEVSTNNLGTLREVAPTAPPQRKRSTRSKRQSRGQNAA